MKTAKLSLILLIAAITISAPISVGYAQSVASPVYPGGSTGTAVSTGATGTAVVTGSGSVGTAVSIGSTGTAVVSTGSTGTAVVTATTGSTGTAVSPTNTGSTASPVYPNGGGSTGNPVTPVISTNTGSTGTPVAPCPAGYTKVGSACQPTVVSCPSGYTLQNGSCIPPVNNNCPANTYLNGGVCAPIVNNSCPTGYYFSGNTCYPNNYQTGGPNYYTPNYYNYNYTNCGYGYYMSGGTCYPNNYQTGGPNYYYPPTTVVNQPPVVISQPTAPTETRYTPAVSTTQTIVRNVTTQTPVSNVVFQPSAVLEIRNIRIFNSADNSTIVTWDTSLPASGQVVFGFTSKPANTPYDFTTGWQNDQVTHREMSLGQLELNRVYYIRINADTSGGTVANSPEMTFIPLPSGKIQVQATGGTDVTGTANAGGGQASVFNIFGLALSGTALLALLMILVIIILAVIAIRRRGATYNN